MSRLSKKDWLEEGFAILSEFNQDKLRIQYLCQRLKVTRGSFYHHFEGIEGYITALMKEWKRRNTLTFIEVANRQISPLEKLAHLNAQVMRTDQAVEAAIRSWSFYHERVREAVQEVDTIRINYLRAVFEDMQIEEPQATYRAKLEYAILIGLQFLFPNITEVEMKELFQYFAQHQP